MAATGRTQKGTRQLCALELLKALQGCYKRTRACMYTYIGVEVGFFWHLYAFPSSVTPPTHNPTSPNTPTRPHTGQHPNRTDLPDAPPGWGIARDRILAYGAEGGGGGGGKRRRKKGKGGAEGEEG